jgi:hypothetical protein
MRIVLSIVVAAALAWAGYWFIGAQAVVRGVTTAQTRAEDAGLTLRFTPEINGFPNRFDLTLNDPAFRDPASGIGWQAAFLQLFALSYQPHKLIAVWPNAQTLWVDGREIAIASSDMRASAALRPLPSLPLEQLIFIAEGLQIGPEGAGLRMDTLRLALRDGASYEGGDGAGDGASYDLGAEILGLVPDPALTAPVLARLPEGAALPGRIERAHVEARVTLDRPLDRAALQLWTDRATPPRPQEIRLDRARLLWGGLEMIASGTLTLGAGGVLAGRIDTQTTGWQAIAPLAEAAGLIRPETAQTFANALQVLASLSQPPERLDLPLILQDGRISFGPLDLGPAPRLR